MLSLDERLARFTPISCRLFARRSLPTGVVVALTDAEVAAGSGLSVPEVCRLSRKTRWDGIPVDTMVAFMKGCGVDITSRESIKSHEAIKRRSRGIPLYLRRAPHWETELKPLLILSNKSQNAQAN